MDEIEVKVTVPETELEPKTEEPTLIAIAMTVGKIAASLEHIAQRQEEQKASIEELWNKTTLAESTATMALNQSELTMMESITAEMEAAEMAEEVEPDSNGSVETLEVEPEPSESKSEEESEVKDSQKHPMKSVWDHF